VHRIEIPEGLIARIIARRGRLHVFDAIEPDRTAHVVVDLQHGFMAAGQPAEIAPARDIVPNVNRISAALRQAGGVVVYIQHTIDAEGRAAWANWYRSFSHPERRARVDATFAEGGPGHALWAELDVRPEDLVVRKRRFSAFIPGSSDLHAILQARGIDTLIISGTATNTCCESTARDASMMNYQVIFAADGTATHTDAEHNATLGNMMSLFADVMTTEEIVALLAKSAG
jgi:ureidoacrylate peracid hydrolase